MPISSWILLGSGTYNYVYKSADSKLVLKIQRDSEVKTDTPERSVRIWNEINANLHPPAVVATVPGHGKGWICPFVKGQQASDQEMSDALIEIYNRTGRIVVDATAPKNFLKTDPPNSSIICVDIGMALQMELRESGYFFSQRSLTKSTVSLDTWSSSRDDYTSFFQKTLPHYPKTVNTVKALLFIKNNRPDIFNAGFLQKNYVLAVQLAAAYDSQNVQTALARLDSLTSDKRPIGKSAASKCVHNARDELEMERPITLENIKESCAKELQQYIYSRGSFNDKEKFIPSLSTRFFRNIGLTTTKALAATALINTIQKVSSLNDLQQAIQKVQESSILLKSTFYSGFGTSLGKCLLMTDMAKATLNHVLSTDSSSKILRAR